MNTNDDKLHDHCGVVGLYGVPDAAKYAYLCLYALQHRGQESTGIVSLDDDGFHHQIGLGKVNSFFTEEKLVSLPGHAAIGHNRYSTAGRSTLREAQPFFFRNIAIAHNGNLTNTDELKKRLVLGTNLLSTSDTEILLRLIVQSHEENFKFRLMDALMYVKGAYSLVFLTHQGLFATRDPYGFRPLILGRLQQGYVVASETCAFDIIGAEIIREVEPGEIIRITDSGIHSSKNFAEVIPQQCVFELVYFSRPDSTTFGQNVYNTRKAFGKRLAEESFYRADMVIPVPDSGVPAALGYAEEAGIPFELGIIRNHYVGRTFIEPEQEIRNFGVKIKLNPNKELLKGKSIILIDDSLVRGTTMKKLIEILRQSDVKEIHVRISSPPIIHPCLYGIDTPSTDELIAFSHTPEEIACIIGADTLKYLSYDGMMSVMKDAKHTFCGTCFTGRKIQ